VARIGSVLLALAAALVAAPASAGPDVHISVFNGEGNRLNAYDAETLEKQTVIPAAADDADGGRDINAQICFDPAHLDSDPETPHFFIAGEDTGQESGQTVEGGQGWGYFELHGDHVGEFTWEQVGKLDPTYNNTADNPENYGCGYLSDGRLLTSDVGDQQPQSGANGQLIVWFPPFDRTDVPYCKVDVTIPTAGQILVEDDRVFVGAQRPDFADPVGNPGGIYLYEGDWPTSDDADGGCGRQDPNGSPLVDEGRVERSVFIRAGHPFLATPSAVVRAPAGGYYASSVFDGKISEFDADGGFVRPILVPSPTNPVPPYDTGTPFGLGIDRNGTLYYADIGIVLGPPPGPGNGNGHLRRITFDADGNPSDPEVIDAGLAFPDGIGILEVPVAAPLPPPSGPAAPDPAPAPEASLPTTGGGATTAVLGLAGLALWRRRRG
jgi:hypothetical protein